MNTILMISGKQGSGKTTLSDTIKKYAVDYDFDFVSTLKFADTLYELHEYLLNKMETLTGKPRIKKDGKLLQILGTEWGRENFGENVWVDILKKKIEKLESQKSKRLIIIDDCRFENEFDAFPEALRVRLYCAENVRKLRTDAWRDNTNHPSEIGLDDYSAKNLFDVTYDTSINEPMNIAGNIFTLLNSNSWKNGRKQ